MFRLLALVFLLVWASTAAAAQSKSLAIVGATIIDGTGRAPIRDGVILVERQRIVSIGARDDIDIPGTAHLIDVTGKYAIPGIMDANVHLFFDATPEGLLRFEGRYEDAITEAAQVSLKSGVTTVFDSWGPRQPLVNVKSAINSGAVVGSRIYLAGNIVGMDGPISVDFDPSAADYLSKAFVDRTNDMWVQGVGRELLWQTPEAIRSRIGTYLEKGVDFIKYASSGHGSNTMEFVAFSPDQQRAIVDAARSAGATVQAHTTSVESLKIAVNAGVDLVQHCEITGPTPIPETTLRLMAASKTACAALPYTKRRLDFERKQMSGVDFFLARLPVAEENIRNMIAHGVVFVLATDSGLLSVETQSRSPVLFGEERLSELGKGHVFWMKAMHQKGMPVMDILKAATSNVARAYKVDGELGTLEPGKIADIVVLDESPLSKISTLQIYSMIVARLALRRAEFTFLLDALFGRPRT